MRNLLGQRGWTQEELASITGYSRQQINRVISGEHSVTPEMAIALGAAFGDKPDAWLEMDSRYRLSLIEDDTGLIAERARMYEYAPIKDMQKRGWIKQTKKIEELDAELRRFFHADSMVEPPQFPVSTRKTDSLSDLSPSQRAWCFRARELAESMILPRKTKSYQAPGLLKDLRSIAAYPKEVRRLPETLATYGILFVVVEPLPGAKIDGAAFWTNQDTPVVAVSARYDRIDAFWFTVMHEISHIRNQDSLSVDTDLSGSDTAPSLLKNDIEQRADREAASSLVDPTKLESFIRRVGPLYSKARIIQFAHTIKMHPGIIVGQLQHLGELGYSSQRDLLVKIRHLVTDVAFTDGWGRTISPDVLGAK